jgi:hypothetical protein
MSAHTVAKRHFLAHRAEQIITEIFTQLSTNFMQDSEVPLFLNARTVARIMAPRKLTRTTRPFAPLDLDLNSQSSKQSGSSK